MNQEFILIYCGFILGCIVGALGQYRYYKPRLDRLARIESERPNYARVPIKGEIHTDKYLRRVPPDLARTDPETYTRIIHDQNKG